MIYCERRVKLQPNSKFLEWTTTQFTVRIGIRVRPERLPDELAQVRACGSVGLCVCACGCMWVFVCLLCPIWALAERRHRGQAKWGGGIIGSARACSLCIQSLLWTPFSRNPTLPPPSFPPYLNSSLMLIKLQWKKQCTQPLPHTHRHTSASTVLSSCLLLLSSLPPQILMALSAPSSCTAADFTSFTFLCVYYSWMWQVLKTAAASRTVWSQDLPLSTVECPD